MFLYYGIKRFIDLWQTWGKQDCQVHIGFIYRTSFQLQEQPPLALIYYPSTIPLDLPGGWERGWFLLFPSQRQNTKVEHLDCKQVL